MEQENLKRIRFIRGCDGHMAGDEIECTAGMADAYVTYRHSAEYVIAAPPEAKSMKSPRDKMMRPEAAATK